MFVVWNAEFGTPERTYFSPHENGVIAMDISEDKRYIVTLSNNLPQTISLWDLENYEIDEPIVSSTFTDEKRSFQRQVKFNTSNVKQIMTTGLECVLFFDWQDNIDKFSYYEPLIPKNTFSKKERANAELTQSVFLPQSTGAVTATKKGDVLVWNLSQIVDGVAQPNERRLIKVVQLMDKAINTLSLHGDYIVTACADGTVKFYDFYFKIVAWFEHLEMASLMSISFSNCEPEQVAEWDDDDLDFGLKDDKDKVEPFKCSPFIVADANAVIQKCRAQEFEAVHKKDPRDDIILDSVKKSIKCIAVNPNIQDPYLAVAGEDGFFMMWNYETKESMPIDYQDGSVEPTCMEYTPDGQCLIVGYATGLVRFLELDMEDNEQVHSRIRLKNAQVAGKTSEKNPKKLTGITVAQDSLHFATMDAGCGVCLFKKDYKYGNKDDPIEWVFSGKQRSHQLEVTSISFGTSLGENANEQKLRLFSIGKDRRLFEYDIENSSEADGLKVLYCFQIEQEASPTASIWYSKIDNQEDLLLTVNDEYKLKLWNCESKASRKTVLGPTYGGEIVKLKQLDVESNSNKYLIYSTKEKVIGLMKLPIDGNPNKTMGLIAHPDKVVDMAVTSDGKYLFTTGGKDLSINMWQIDVDPIEDAILLGGDDPFINLIEGGRDGQTYADMKDFFYYSMIRSKDENTTKTRKLDGTVPLEELPNLMRAMGHYPTEKEIENMINEVKYSEFSNEGNLKNSFDLDTFVRLFVNHRPVYGIGKPHIEKAFDAIKGDKELHVQRDRFVNKMTREGDVISTEDLQKYLHLLVGDGNFMTALKEELRADEFSKDVLGFEEVEEDDLEEEEEENEEEERHVAFAEPVN